jgi:octaprenyl-diphosphate synthase
LKSPILEKQSISTQLQKVDDVIRSSLSSDVPLINQVAKHIIDGGGKKMRPQCLINLAGLAGSVQEVHYQLAAIIEFIHTATLLHDDVVDESDVRRNSPTANIKFGNSASILVGDFIYSRSFQMMVELNSIEIMDTLALTTNKIAEGEVLQLINKNNVEMSEDDYQKIIQNKTGVLFQACGKLASTGNNCSYEQMLSLSEIGLLYGQIYQLIDDILDYSGDASLIGKNIGDDLKDGKMTLPLLIAFKNSNSFDKEIIRKAVNQGDLGQLTKIIAIINNTKSLSIVHGQINTLAEKLKSKLESFENNYYKERVLNFLAEASERSF